MVILPPSLSRQVRHMAKKKNRAVSSIASRPHKTAPATRATEMYGWMNMSGTGGRNQDLMRSDNGAALAYEVVSIVYRCTNLIAQAINALPWDIVAGEGENEKVIASSEDRRPKHPFAKAAQEVYNAQRIPFFSLVVYSRLLFGETYIEKMRNSFGYPRGLRWLNPVWTEPDTFTGEITRYRYGAKNGREYIYLPPDCVAYDKTFNPSDDLRGYSTVDAALDAVNIDRNLKRYLRAFFRNNARPGLVIAPEGGSSGGLQTSFSPQDSEIIKRQFAESHMGVNNQHTAIVAPKPMTVTPLENPDVQKQYSLTLDIMREICIAFGVPLAMAGDSSSSTYKDGQEVKKAFEDTTIKPLAVLLQDFINADVLPFFDSVSQYGEDTTFRFDLTSLDDSVPGEKALAELIDMRLKSTQMTLAEGQRAQGLVADPQLENIYLVENIPVPGDKIATYWERKLPPPAPAYPAPTISAPETPQLSVGLMQQHELATEGVAQESAPPLTLQDMALANEAPAVQKEMAGVAVILSLANNVDLLALQRDLQVKFSDQSIEWNTPDTFHVTLLFLPIIDDESLDHLVTYIADNPPPEFRLNVGSLASFDNLNEHALHFRIRRNDALDAYQEGLYQFCEQIGLQTSQYSVPDNWKPHVTMGYAAQRIPSVTFSSHLLVSPIDVHVSVEREGEYEIVGCVPCGQTATKHTHTSYVFPTPLSRADWQEKALNELKAWQRYVKAGKRAFEPNYAKCLFDEWPERPYRGIASQEFFDYAFVALKTSAFEVTQTRVDNAFNLPALRSLSDTRQEFEDEFLLAIADAKEGGITTSQLKSILDSVIDSLGERAYFDGLEDGGIKNAVLDDDDRATIARLKTEAKRYLTDFVSQFDTYTNIQLDQRPRLWSNKTLQGFYDHGLAAADANGIYVWRLGKTESHCSTCLQMNGQQMRMKTWLKNGILPQSDKLECGGWNCDCGLFNIRGGAKG